MIEAMRVAIVCAVAIVLAALQSDAKRVVRRPPSIADLCRGPATWDTLAKCANEHGAKHIDEPRGTLRTISDDHTSYLFARDADGRWWLALPYPKTGYTILERTSQTIGGNPVDRIEARYQIDMGRLGRSDLVVQRIAILCRARSCSNLVYACTRFQDGRATETLLGTIEAEGASFKVTGDRSQGGQMCR